MLFLSISAAEPLPPGLIACMIEKNDMLRLQCFDRQTEALASTNADMSKNAPANQVPALTAEQKFGMRGELARKAHEQSGESAKSQILKAQIVGVSERARGELVITLDNGQIWAQTQASFARVKPTDTVTIEQGVLGAFILSTSTHSSMKVRRIR